ncbi:MAG: HAD family hydrolase [Rubricoccaceae bacterium]|nr:HAD family hydrolase [Rubricoccaceae bacterium]
MIKLFLSDIDGCLCQPYEAYDVDGFGRIREWIGKAEEDSLIPRFGLCSGRSYAYVEAIAQLLDLRAPALFESGGGRFDLQDARIRWNPELTPEVETELDAVRTFFLRSVVGADAGFSLDYGKRAQTGVVNASQREVERFLPMVRDFVTRELPDLRVYETHASIDVVPKRMTKLQAIRWVADQEELTLEEIAFIGDSRGDVEAISAVGVGFSPQNGSFAAREAADVVTRGAVIQGVLEAFEWCVERNRAERRHLAERQ